MGKWKTVFDFELYKLCDSSIFSVISVRARHITSYRPLKKHTKIWMNFVGWWKKNSIVHWRSFNFGCYFGVIAAKFTHCLLRSKARRADCRKCFIVCCAIHQFQRKCSINRFYPCGNPINIQPLMKEFGRCWMSWMIFLWNVIHSYRICRLQNCNICILIKTKWNRLDYLIFRTILLINSITMLSLSGLKKRCLIWLIRCISNRFGHWPSWKENLIFWTSIWAEPMI